TVARDRWQSHLKSRGRHYHEQAAELEALAATRPEVGAGAAALAHHALAEVLEHARLNRLTRHQHVLFRLGELISVVEAAGALARRAARAVQGELPAKAVVRLPAGGLAAASRIYAREAAARVGTEGLRWTVGAGDGKGEACRALQQRLGVAAIHEAQAGLVADMDEMARELYARLDG
ncbi:MAG TPA: hypothetical protein VE173_10500, partial [Longimicrobiales bacterium]|nr:hypothetical protein [Longimicrobiales bacterium]